MKKMDYPTINITATGSRIDNLRRENGISVAAMRDFLGLSTTNAIYKWLRGETLPTLDNVVALSTLFEVPIDDLIISNK
jgi:transcriptional regulator with XRE-family HTH domain